MPNLPQSARQALTRIGLLSSIALLSGCAARSNMSAQQESGSYLSRARGNYSPPGPASDPWGPYVREAAAKFDVPDRWIREVMRQESGGHLFNRNGQLITSGAGAMGLMQVMPATYDEIRGRYPELGDDPFDPHNNILAGTAYIREMFDIYGSPGFLAAYNAGPGRMDDYLTRNRTLPEETRRYVANIGPRIAGTSPSRGSPGEQYAMNSTPLPLLAGPRYPVLVSPQFASADTASASPIVLRPVQPDYSGVAPIELRPIQPFPQTPAQQFALPQMAEAALPQIDSLRPVQLATAQEPEVLRSEPIRLNPPRIEPPPLEGFQPAPQIEPFRAGPGRAEPRPDPAPFRQASAPLPEPPRPRFSQVAPQTLPIPVPPAPAPVYAALQPSMLARQRFQFVSSAVAAPALHRGNAMPGSWAVQVGAFNNPGLAISATAAARDQVRDVLGSAHPVVASVRQSNGILYRARLTGLSHGSATQACERLVRVRTSCMLVSPDAQS